nr:polycomb protein Asx-like [Penaeus vannamei]
MTTMQTYLAAIPGFKPRKRSQRKLSAAAQLAQTKEGNVDLETPDSILTSVNLRALLNKHTFGSLPPAYQHRLIKLLPMVDQSVGADDTLKVIPTGLNNEFFGRACESWRCRLGEGEFTHDNQVKLKVEAERERTKLDPWKVAHFEPLWGVKQGWCSTEGETSSSSPPSPSGGSVSMSPPQESHTTPAFTSSFSDIHISQLTKVLEHIATRNERRAQRRTQRRAERRKQRERELAEELSRCSASQASSINPSANSLLGLPSALPAPQTPSLATATPVTLPLVPSSSPLPPNSLSLFTSSSLPLHASKNNLSEVTSGVHAVFSAEEKLPLQSHVVNVDSVVLSKDILKRKDGLALTTTTPSKKIRVSNADVTNSFVVKPGPTSATAQILTTPVSCQSEAPRTTRVPTTSVTGTPKVVSSSVSINNPTVATGAPGVPIKPTSVMVVSAPSSAGSAVVVTNPRMSPAARISPVTRVSPSPSPSRLSPVVQVVSPSLSLAPSQSPPASRTVVVAGQTRPVEVSSSAPPVSHVANTVVQPLPTSSVASLTSRVKPVRTPQGLSGAGTIALKVTRSRPPGGVNIQRSYEIVQAVIANSPNRDQLQAQLKTPAALLADVKPSTSGQTVVAPSVSSGNTIVTNPVNSQVVVQAAPQNQVQTITVVKAVATTSSNSTSSTSPVQGAQLITSGPRMVRQVALSVSGAAGTTVMPPIAGTPGTMVLRQMVTPQSLSTPSQVPLASSSRASSLLLDGKLRITCGGGVGGGSSVSGSGGSGGVGGNYTRDSSTVTNIPESNVIVSGQNSTDVGSCSIGCDGEGSGGSVSGVASISNVSESLCSFKFGEPVTTMVVMSQPSGVTPVSSRVLVLHPSNNSSEGISDSSGGGCSGSIGTSSGPLLVSFSAESQHHLNPQSDSSDISPISLNPPNSPSPLTVSAVPVIGGGITHNSQPTPRLSAAPSSAVCLPNSHSIQHEVCEGSMAPPTATSRPITILRPTTGGKQIVVQTVPVSSLQVLRLKNISSVNGEGLTSSDAQHPPRAASAPPNKSGVMVALAPRPSSVGPRIVVQTSSAQGSPATILTSAGQHFLSEGDPSPGVSSCDSDQHVTTRAGASQSSDISSENIQENQVESLAPVTSAASVQLTTNCTGPGTGTGPGSGNEPAVTTVSSVINSFQNLNNNPSMPPQSVQHQHPQHPVASQHPNMPVRPNMRMMMNNMPHINNMQTLNNMQPMNNVAQMNPMPGMNGMASMNMQGNPANQGMHAMPPQIKGDNNEDGCPCNMKAMIMCMKCGAFCHHDCIGPARLCVACLIR